MNYWIDTHAHIYLEDFDADREVMLARAKEHSVEKIFMPNIDQSSIDRMLELESSSKGSCQAMMGLHPCSVNAEFQRELYIVEQWLSKRKFSAIGEIGTDLYWDKTFWDQQKEAFKIQLDWSKQYDLPVVIHCRESLDETIAIVEGLQDGKLKGIFHCFTGDASQAKRIINLGFLLGIGGVATFKNSGMDKVLPEVELKNIVLETDSPYLTPTPHRGKRNEPSYIPLIAKRVAEIYEVSLGDVQTTTTHSALKLFNQL